MFVGLGYVTFVLLVVVFFNKSFFSRYPRFLFLGRFSSFFKSIFNHCGF